MLDNCCVPTCNNIVITKPSNTLTYIFHILTGNRYDQIPRRYSLQRRCQLNRYKGQRFVCKSAILCIDLSIVNASYPFLRKITLLKPIPSNNLSNIAQVTIFNDKLTTKSPKFTYS